MDDENKRSHSHHHAELGHELVDQQFYLQAGVLYKVVSLAYEFHSHHAKEAQEKELDENECACHHPEPEEKQREPGEERGQRGHTEQ